MMVDADKREACAGQALAVMTRVRARLVTDHPFFGDLALRLHLKPDFSCRDMWTDGRVLAFNPLYATAIREEKLVGAQAHEVLHLVFGHHLRRNKREKRLWNRACDFAINGILMEAGFLLPDGFLYDAALTGKSADEIYDILVARMAKAREARLGHQAGSDKGGELQQTKNGASDTMMGLPRPANPDDGAARAVEGEDKDRVRQQGRGVIPVTGREKGGRPSEDKVAHFDGEVRDVPDLEAGEGSEEAAAAAEREAEITLAQAVNRARHMGALPAGIAREVEHLLPAQVDWREILQRFLAACADNDYTWTAPNRRYVHQNIYMPSRWEQRLDHIVIAVDASGSVDAATLAMFMGELQTVLEFFDTRLTVLFHDTKVHDMQSLSRADLSEVIVPVGGGGTDFRPIPEALEQEGIHPRCLVWFTDLECTRFPEEPGYPVLWMVPKPGGETPPFGEVVYMSEC